MFAFKPYDITKTFYLPKNKLDDMLYWKGMPKSTISFINDSEDFHMFLDGKLISHNDIITNNVKSYRDMPFFKGFHSHIGELTVEFKFDNQHDIPFPKKLLGLVRGANFRPDGFDNSQYKFELKEDYYTSQYLYYTLFI